MIVEKTFHHSTDARPSKTEREDVMAAKAAATKLGARLRGLSPAALQVAMPQIVKELGPEFAARIGSEASRT